MSALCRILQLFLSSRDWRELMTPADRAVLDTLPENELLALTAFLEARSEPVLGLIAVMWVVRNRAAQKRYGKTVRECCLWPQQFSCFNDGDPGQALAVQIARHLRRGESILALPDGIILAVCLFLADRVLGLPPKQVPDPTKGATHYFAPRVLPHEPPWATLTTGAELTVTIGAHRFYRNVA